MLVGFVGFGLTYTDEYKEKENIKKEENKKIAEEKEIKKQEVLIEKKRLAEEKEKEKEQKKLEGHELFTITQKDMPKTYKKWGKAYIERINALMPKAAELVVKASNCDQLSYVNLSDNESIPKEIVYIYADCKNGERFMMSESDINNGNVPKSINQIFESYDEFDLIGNCANLIKKSLKFPSSFDLNGFYSKAKPTGSFLIEIYVAFDAKNSFGAELPQQGYCTMKNNIVTLNSIENR
ncbi:hypothetical protein [Advenella sp. EE-W14]|uniref:hypothetical protein n=1 Tax=Advenella sp. EE-W14 TaxID=2722705 RepID=UPI00145E421D|nr:hypothetical protein [Advenella sp. EE-W14]